MSNFTKKTSLSFIVILMLTMLMMSISYAVSFVGADFDLDNIPKSTTLHLGQNIILPSEEPVGEYGRWEIISGQNRAKMYQGRMLETLKTGTVKVSYPANSGETYTVSIKITNHKYDKSTDLCSCGARRPVSSMKFSKSSYAFTEDMGTIDMSKYLNVKPASTASNVEWYANTVSAWYGGSVATINLTSGKLSLKDYGTGRIRAVDYVSRKEVSVPFAVFNKELLSQYTLCIDENLVLPVAERGARWEIVSGDNKVEELYNGAYKGVKTGTVKLVYSTEVGDFTTKIKVANHKYNKTTGLCVCGAKQPPKTMKFTESTFRFAETSGEVVNLADSKYISVKPEGIIDELEWRIDTWQSWYVSNKFAEVDEDGNLEFVDWGAGKLYATHPESGKEIEANIIFSSSPIPEELEIHVGQTKSLGVIGRFSEYAIVKGDTKVELSGTCNSVVKGLDKGTATLVCDTAVGDITVKVKVLNHKFNSKTGLCSCGAKQPPKLIKFNATTFGFDYYDESVDMSDSKYLTINPEGAKDELEWYFTTASSWYANTEVVTVDDDGNVTFNDWGTGRLYATHKESGKTISTKIIVGCGDIPTQIDMHVGKEVYLPVIERNSKWYISKGSNVVLDGNYTQFVRGTKAGSATLVYPSAVGDITVKVKVSNHKYDKTTGLCLCGDALPPKVFKFNSTTYEVAAGTTDFSTSKYLTISPTNALTDLRWYVDTISSWYGGSFATVTQDGEVKVNNGTIGIGKLVVIDQNSGKEAMAYILKADKPHQTSYTVHVGKGINLPIVAKTDTWEVLSGEDYVTGFGSYIQAEKPGTAKVRHNTEVGSFDSTIKVVNHSFDSNGECSCGERLSAKTLEFKNSTYILTKGEYDLSSSKYLNITPPGTNVDLEWDIEILKKWYSGELATIEDDGMLVVENNSGYGEVIVRDEISGLEANCEIIIPSSYCEGWEEEYELHLGKAIRLPYVYANDKWEILNGDQYVELYSDGYVTGEALGTVSVRYTTPSGNILNAKIKVTDHTFNSNGECSCGEESIEIPDRPIEVLEALGIMSGYPDGSFKPGRVMNRAEAARLLVAFMNVEALAEAEARNSFNDELLKDGEAYAWARGYVEVAHNMGILKGYPDGSFKPEDPITNAEFFTCIINALGYGKVVEQEGTWPTNVMVKCLELRLLDDVPYEKTSDQLTRGAAAVICYNALGTQMWKITGENEGSGMTGGIDAQYASVKFPDFVYSIDGIVEDITVKESRVIIEIKDEEKNTNVTGEVVDIELLELAVGMNVTTLYDRNKEKFILFYNDERIVKGLVTNITEEYIEIDGKEYEYGENYSSDDFEINEYIVGARDARELKAVVVLPLESTLVRKIAQAENEIGEGALVIIDGEWTSVDDIEVGDVYTQIDNYGDPFYVVSRERWDGTFEGLVEEEDKEKTTLFVYFDGDEFEVIDGLFEAYEGEDNDEEIRLSDLMGEDNKYLDKEAELIFNYAEVPVCLHFGEVIGELTPSINFFGVEENIDRDGRSYLITLANEDGSDVYEFATGSKAETEAQQLWANAENEVGSFGWVKLDEEGNITERVLVANYKDGLVDSNDVEYGERENEYYTFLEMTAALYEEDERILVDENEEQMLISKNTILVTLAYDDKGTDNDSDDEYRIEFDQGLDAFEDIKNDDVVVIYDAAETFIEAKYVLVWSDASDESMKKVAKVLTLDGSFIDLEDEDGDEFSYRIADDTEGDLSKIALIVYTITEDSKGKEILNFVDGLNNEELADDCVEHWYVGECKTGRRAVINGEEVELDGEEWTDLYEDYMVVLVEVDESDTDGEYEVYTFEIMDYDSMSLKESDRLAIRDDSEIIFLIRGMERIEE